MKEVGEIQTPTFIVVFFVTANTHILPIRNTTLRSKKFLSRLNSRVFRFHRFIRTSI